MEQQEFARHLRRQMTESENRLWRQLRAHRLNGEKFRPQQPIGPYVVDFVHFGVRLIVEADGGQHNDAPHDKRRDTWLHEQGFRVLRFWNNEIMANLDGVLATIMDAVTNPPSPPAPLPQGERGDSGSGRPVGDTDPRLEAPLPQGERGDSGSGRLVGDTDSRLEAPLPLRERGWGEGLGKGGQRDKKRAATQHPVADQ